MLPTYKRIHPNFRLNGVAITFHDLDEVSYSLIKEGKPFEQIIGGFLLDWIDDDNSLTVRTSGSTGTPKLISLGKQQMVDSALATGFFFNLKPKDTALLCLPAEFVAGKMMLVRAMILGLHLDTIEPLSHPLGSNSKNYDFCAMIPLQLERSLPQINRIKTLIVGGAPLSSRLKEDVQNVKPSVYETYGMTETITHIALKKINHCEENGVENTEIHFKTMPNVTIQKDERDCLVINAPKINEVPIITNDLVNLISNTEFEWLGRYDNIINSGGIKLIPEQIEFKLNTIIKNRFFVAGIPDNKLGQRLILLVEGISETKELLEKIRTLKTLDKYEIPKDILCSKTFVETVNGKISRRRTLQQVLNS